MGVMKIILHIVKSTQPSQLGEMISCFSRTHRTGMINDIKKVKQVVNFKIKISDKIRRFDLAEIIFK